MLIYQIHNTMNRSKNDILNILKKLYLQKYTSAYVRITGNVYHRCPEKHCLKMRQVYRISNQSSWFQKSQNNKDNRLIYNYFRFQRFQHNSFSTIKTTVKQLLEHVLIKLMIFYFIFGYSQELFLFSYFYIT